MRALKALAYLVYFAAVIVLGFFVLKGFSSVDPRLATATAAPKVAQAPSRPSEPKTPSKASPSTASPPKAATPSTAPATTSNASLSNTGPGDVIGLFVVVSLGAALLHWRWQTSRQA